MVQASSATHKADLRYLLRFLKPHTATIVATLFFLLAGQVAESLDPIWLKKIIDGLTTGSTFHQLGSVIAIYFVWRILSALFSFLRDVVFAPTEMGISRTLSDQLFTHLLSLPISYHVEQKIGGTSRKITRGGRAVTFILDFLVINILPTIIQLIVVTIILFKLYAPAYAIITFVTIVGYTAFTLWATEKRQKFRIAANEADDEVASLEVGGLSNIDTVKYFNNEPYMHQRYQPAINKRYDLSVSSNQLFAAVEGGQGLILTLGLGSILLLAIRQTISHQLTIGDLVLLTTYLTRLSAPIGTLGFIYRQIKDGLADLDGMARMLNEPITIKEPEHPEHISKPTGAVSFKDVQFEYTNGREILKGISIDVKPGQKVAFVGPSGVGKSTIVKLLFRIYEPTAGSIVIDGVPLNNLTKEDRRNIFAIVPQEPALFNASIRENIAFGKPDATDAEIKRAAQLASIDELIEKLPEKYDTVVGERGVKLSGGEKQRVAIARAIIRDPKVIVFDEATSSLDSKSERDILGALNAVSEGRTTLAVAHRLSTIVNSDTIYVLNEGKVAEFGRHEELLAKEGIYAKLWKLQAEAHQGIDEEAEITED